MEAPEKIYLWESELCGRDYDDEWFDQPLNGDSVEYTRTDAFIEKVCKFLDDRIKHDSIDYPMATNSLIEDFKKYMEE